MSTAHLEIYFQIWSFLECLNNGKNKEVAAEDMGEVIQKTLV